ncbi:YjjG family noncanonical pyrimidine nucleotidase [Staphylococcus sp. ACRSN]|uniref:YjjG family noncanonical pyrimidine nucleotidase n=1 Tax=Staphylococcus sp. ACRSN TaxID=2918214 RepID=UPI001EF3AB1D|nr:YjjG family noncanonical pyrimidine nucleotidase [Staphylococcus sp. ACRSN]MCG7338726.1 YjjG family noncanonical pyrimidine nucleotidase [Staphylococcus sp. ACRSN]
MDSKNIFLDFDDTLVDFHDAEAYAFYKLTKYYKVESTFEDLKLFMKVNQSHWEAFQNNLLTKSEVLSKRFEAYFDLQALKVNGEEADHVFRDELANAPIKYFPKTLETLEMMKEHHNLYIVTNGVLETQERRIDKTPFGKWFDGVFVSEQTGYQKPMPEFFDFVFNEIGEEKRENAIIIGDSLTSDILGGKNANIDTCWFNPRQKVNDTQIMPDFTISSLSELTEFI